jgi:hypothetical protein
MDLGSVRVKIEGDPSKLQADLKAAEAAAANAGGKIAEAFNKSAGSMNNTTATIKQVASGITQTGEAAEKAGQKVQTFVGAIPGLGVAAERFIGLIPGLGQVLVNLFPVLGAIAFATAIVRITGNITELFEGAGKGGSVIHAAFADLIQAGRQTNDELQLSNDKLANEIAKIEHRPQNGLKEALDEARVAADKLQTSLAKDLKTIQEIFTANKVGFARQIIGEAGTEDIEERLRAFQVRVATITEKGNQSIQVATNTPEVGGVALFSVEASQALKRAAQTKLNTELTKEYSTEVARLQNLLKSAVAPPGGYAVDKSARIALLEGEIASLQEQAKGIGLGSINANLKGDKDSAQQPASSREKYLKSQAESDIFWRDQHERQLKDAQAQRDAELRGTVEFNAKMLEVSERGAKDLAEQQQRWKKINIDAKDQRVTQSKIDVPLAARTGEAFAGPDELKKVGILTVDMRKAAIAEDQRLLNMAELMNVPLGTQLQLREEILQKQIDLKAAQGQSVSAELQALDALQAQMDRMHQKAAGIAPMLHDLRGIGGQIPGQLGGALAGGIMGGNPGKGIGQEIRGALQGIGHQILGTVFQTAIQRMVVSLGINTLANTLLKFVFGTAAATQIANTAAVVANTVGQGVLTVSNGILVASNAALTGAVLALTAATVVDAIIPFADGGRPPLGVPSIVGERGPEMFIPDQAGKIVPNHQLAGGAGLMLPMMAAIASNSVGQMNFHAHGMTNPREFVREVARQLPAYLKSTNPKYSPASR